MGHAIFLPENKFLEIEYKRAKQGYQNKRNARLLATLTVQS
jgi:hypothetical protein